MFFLNNIAQPAGQTRKQVMAMYDQFYGRPNEAMKLQLQAAVRKFHQKANSWNDYLEEIGVAPMTPMELTEFLVDGLRGALRKNYITAKKLDHPDMGRGRERGIGRGRGRRPERERTPPPRDKTKLTGKQLMRMVRVGVGPVGPAPDEMEMHVVGPLSMLWESMMQGTQVLIALRNGKKLLGRVRAYDRHMNMLLSDVYELWVHVHKSGKNKGTPRGPVHRDRFISKMLLRGDTIVMVMKNPNSKKEEQEIIEEREEEEQEGMEIEEKEKEEEERTEKEQQQQMES